MRKGRFFRNHDYLVYVSSCLSCLEWPTEIIPQYSEVLTSVCHHVRMGGNGGMGVKPSDYRGVPLRDIEHKLLHQNGERSFWQTYRLNPDEIIISLMIGYIKNAACAAETSLKYVGDTKGLMDALEDLIEDERYRHGFPS